MSEPNIIINGVLCSNAQAMTLRVAIGSFIMSLKKDGLGNDDVGIKIKDGYLKAANEIQLQMLKGDKN